MSRKIATFKNRDESHQHLAELLKANPASTAECREDSAKGEYSVWSGPELRLSVPERLEDRRRFQREKAAVVLDETAVDMIVDKLLKKQAAAAKSKRKGKR